MKFIDGTEVPKDYQKRLTGMISDPIEAENHHGGAQWRIEKLEEHASSEETKKENKD